MEEAGEERRGRRGEDDAPGRPRGQRVGGTEVSMGPQPSTPASPPSSPPSVSAGPRQNQFLQGPRYPTGSPRRGACSCAADLDPHFLSVPWQISPSRPWTKARLTAVPSGPSLASFSRSSSWAGSTLFASVWCASATPGPTGPSRMSTSVGRLTCPSIS